LLKYLLEYVGSQHIVCPYCRCDSDDEANSYSDDIDKYNSYAVDEAYIDFAKKLSFDKNHECTCGCRSYARKIYAEYPSKNKLDLDKRYYSSINIYYEIYYVYDLERSIFLYIDKNINRIIEDQINKFKNFPDNKLISKSDYLKFEILKNKTKYYEIITKNVNMLVKKYPLSLANEFSDKYIFGPILVF
jgi:hypothetical protein